MVDYKQIYIDLYNGKSKPEDLRLEAEVSSDIGGENALVILNELVENYAMSKRLRIEDLLSNHRDIKGFNYIGRFSYEDFYKKLNSEGSDIAKDYYLSIDEPFSDIDRYLNHKMGVLEKVQEAASAVADDAVRTSEVLTYSGQFTAGMFLMFKKYYPVVLGGAFGSYVMANPEVSKEIAEKDAGKVVVEVSSEVLDEYVIYLLSIITDNIL